MNNEIKEILDKCTPFLFGDEVDKLTDYITNLQQELEKTEECRDELLEVNDVMRKLKERYQHEKHIYKIRIEKAIEYIKKVQEQDDIEIWREDGYWAYVLNILNGGEE